MSVMADVSRLFLPCLLSSCIRQHMAESRLNKQQTQLDSSLHSSGQKPLYMPSLKHLQHNACLLHMCCNTWNLGPDMNGSKNTAASSSRKQLADCTAASESSHTLQKAGYRKLFKMQQEEVKEQQPDCNT